MHSQRWACVSSLHQKKHRDEFLPIINRCLDRTAQLILSVNGTYACRAFELYKTLPSTTRAFLLCICFSTHAAFTNVRLETRGNSSCTIRPFPKGMRRLIAITPYRCLRLLVAFRKLFPFRLKNWGSHSSHQLEIKCWQSHRVVIYILGAVNNESGVE